LTFVGGNFPLQQFRQVHLKIYLAAAFKESRAGKVARGLVSDARS
jgi:hypothetical protein